MHFYIFNESKATETINNIRKKINDDIPINEKGYKYFYLIDKYCKKIVDSLLLSASTNDNVSYNYESDYAILLVYISNFKNQIDNTDEKTKVINKEDIYKLLDYLSESNRKISEYAKTFNTGNDKSVNILKKTLEDIISIISEFLYKLSGMKYLYTASNVPKSKSFEKVEENRENSFFI